MTRIAHLLKGIAALAVLVGFVAGAPWALWHFVGWPLPHHLPSATQVGRALNRQGIPAQTLVDALAVVVWLTWVVLVASLAVEVPAALSGRRARRLPIAGAFQPLTGRLLATVIVACLALAPKPAHPAAPATGPRIGLTSRRPPAALVVRDAVLTGDTTPVASAPAPAIDPTVNGSATLAPVEPAATSVTYTVQRGDTLWGVAQRELGDPLRWSEIYQLNLGRPQPGGVTLTDPHWIDPGWTLLLPASVSLPSSATRGTSPTPASPPPTTSEPPPGPTPPATKTTPTTNPSPTTATTPATAPIPSHNGSASTSAHSGSGSDPVRLPSGSEVAASFAAGVLATVAIGRLRRRHAYRYRPPEPGRVLTPEPLRPTVRHLAAAAQRKGDDTASPASPERPDFPVDDDERRLDPGQLEVGTRDGAAATVEVTELSGVAFTGEGAENVARALIAGLLVRALPGATEILCTHELADRLLPGLAPHRSVRQLESTDRVASAVEAERIGRARRLAGVDAPNATRFRHDNPENPLPLLLVILDEVPVESLGRWTPLLHDAPRLGIAIVLLGESPLATARLEVGAEGAVTAAGGTDAVRSLEGATLYRLGGDEAVDLLEVVNDADYEGDENDAEGIEPEGSVTPLRSEVTSAWRADEPEAAAWPEPAAAEAVGDETARLLAVDILGPYRIAFLGEAVTTGLRSRAKLLLAWSLLRPEGATIDEIVDALWPNTAPDRLLKQFWYPLGDLRTFFRGSDDTSLDVLEKVGEHYRPNPEEINCDLWEFQSALGQAARAGDDEQARAALARAVDAYGGDLLAGLDYPWVEAARQDLHRRAVDAHLRLAELEDQAGRPDAAIDVLERVVGLDRYAEEPYRRLMTLQAAQGRLDAVAATWRLLQRRLAELDLDVDDATARLYHALTAPGTDPARPRPVRLSS